MTLTGNMFSAYRSYFASMKFSRNSYLIDTQKYILRFSVLKPNFLAFRFHPLSSAPSFSSLSIPIFYYLNTYQFYLFAYNGNYRLELLCTADKFPYLPSSYICLGFPASSLYNYICSTLSKSKFIFKPSTLSDSSKK